MLRPKQWLIRRRRKEKYCIIHFFHPDFHRCKIMDKRLDVSERTGDAMCLVGPADSETGTSSKTHPYPLSQIVR